MFETFKEYEQHIKDEKGFLDVVTIDNIEYTQSNYDLSGRCIEYRETEEGESYTFFEVITNNRYNDVSDAEIEDYYIA